MSALLLSKCTIRNCTRRQLSIRLKPRLFCTGKSLSYAAPYSQLDSTTINSDGVDFDSKLDLDSIPQESLTSRLASRLSNKTLPADNSEQERPFGQSLEKFLEEDDEYTSLIHKSISSTSTTTHSDLVTLNPHTALVKNNQTRKTLLQNFFLQFEPNSTVSSLGEDELTQKILHHLQRSLTEYENKALNKALSNPADIEIQFSALENWKALAASLVFQFRNESVDKIMDLLDVMQVLDSRKMDPVVDFVYSIHWQHSSRKAALRELTNSITSRYIKDVSQAKVSKFDPELAEHGYIRFLITSHDIKSKESTPLIQDAIQELWQLEEPKDSNKNALFPLRQTYTMVASALLERSKVNPSCRPLLWDVYARSMLYSHPIPSLELYNIMIKACATGPSPAPERAIELYENLTLNSLQPNVDTYSYLIQALCRSRGSSKSLPPGTDIKKEREKHREQYIEALRLLENMFDQELAPSIETLTAILVGCQVQRDLGRARWIWWRWTNLKAQYELENGTEHESSSSSSSFGGNETESMESILFSKIINVYKAYPSAVRSGRRLNLNAIIPSNWPSAFGTLPDKLENVTNEVQRLLMAYLPSDLQVNFANILDKVEQRQIHKATKNKHSIKVKSNKNDDDGMTIYPPGHGPEQEQEHEKQSEMDQRQQVILTNSSSVRVKPGIQLVTAILDYYAQNASFVQFSIIYQNIFDAFNVRKGHLCQKLAMAAALDAKGINGDPKRRIRRTLDFAQPVFLEWQSGDLASLDRLEIEFMYSKMIRLYLIANDLQSALDLVSDFVSKFPPPPKANDDQNQNQLDLINKIKPIKTDIQLSSPLYPETVPLVLTRNINGPRLTMDNCGGDLYNSLLRAGYDEQANVIREIVASYSGGKKKKNNQEQVKNIASNSNSNEDSIDDY